MTVVLLLLLLVVVTGCSAGGSESAEPPLGCGMVPSGKLSGLLGAEVRSTPHGSLEALRSRHQEAGCDSVVPGHAERYVRLSAEYHPDPFELPKKACSEGWVYAGTPEKYTPACQETVDGHGVTQLIVRWQPYILHVTIGRADRDWGGDPERALAISRVVAQRLGVKDAGAG
jgi:hypothetical protein